MAQHPRYILEIYEPDADRSVVTTFESDTPFVGVAAGQVLNLPGYEPHHRLAVTQVEHIFWQIEGQAVAQKLMVFTTDKAGTGWGARALE